jgi:uncharacterized repeat protein (TIGR01451 family)
MGLVRPAVGVASRLLLLTRALAEGDVPGRGPRGRLGPKTNEQETSMRKAIVIALGLLTSTLPASAQVAEPQPLVITAENVTADAAQRAGADTGITVPGDLIEYRLAFTNLTDDAVSNVVVSDPVPGGLVFVPGSVIVSREDVLVEYSIDDGASWSSQPTVEVLEGDEVVRRPAPAEAYTHLRWTVTGTVTPGAEVRARFRARVAGGGDGGAS